MASQPFVHHAFFQAPDASEPQAAMPRFALRIQGPSPSSGEVESAHAVAVEVVIAWGENIVHVTHLSPTQGFTVGDGGDFAMPDGLLGEERASIVRVRNASSLVRVPAGAMGEVEQGGAVTDLAPGAEVQLADGRAVRIRFPQSQLTISVAAVAAGRKIERGLMLGLAAGALQHVGVSALLHASVFGSLAYFMPSMSADDAENSERDQVMMMRHFLDASAEHELEDRKDESSGETKVPSGGEGKRAEHEEGKMGSSLSTATNKAWAKQGPADNPNPELSRAAELQSARTEGLIGLVSALNIADPNAPVKAWGPEAALGRDAQSFMGNMWGAEAGDANGMNGLGMSGSGEGGGGKVPGTVGLGDVGTAGHGTGCIGADCTGGIGRGHGPLRDGGYRPRAIRMTESHTSVNGHIPPEVIQRVVRLNFGRFRNCYETAVKTNPSLAGRVATTFMIGRDGQVVSVRDGGSDMPDQGVVQCVVRSFSGLSFPAPDSGMVTVTYPIVFAPGE